MFTFLKVILCLCVVSVRGQHHLGLLEGENCNSTHVCKRLNQCQDISDVRLTRPKICSFVGRDPVVCCPKPSSIHVFESDAKAPETPTKNLEATTSLEEKKESETQENQNAGSQQAILKCMEYELTSCLSSSLFKREVIHVVVGGKKAKPREHPHMALLGHGSADNKIWHCGGSLISDFFILSAAHCSYPPGGTTKWAKLGDLDYSTLEDEAQAQDFEVVKIFDHPGYNPPAIYNDITLYKLDRRVHFNKWIKPACVFTGPFSIFKNGMATGWGRTGFVGPTSTHLLEVDLDFFENDQCKELLKTGSKYPNGIDTDTMLCAGQLDGSKDTCTGDSGGPLVLTFGCLKRIVGITSFGKQCGLQNSPGIYTKVSHYVPWIESIVWPTNE